MKTTPYYIISITLLLICIHCKGAMKENYDALLEYAATLEQQLVEADSQFNKVQASFRQAIDQHKSKQAAFQEIGNALAVQNSKLAQVDAKLEFVANLKASQFEQKDTILFADLEKVNMTLSNIQEELERIDIQIKRIKE